MSDYQTIFKRRSVRNYSKQQLSKELLDEISDYLNGLTKLCDCSFKFKVAGEVNDSHAPHYILAYCNNDLISYVNIGYVLEKMDLYLQGRGLGSLWLGTAKPTVKNEVSDYCIMLAFGNTNVPERVSEDSFKRLSLDEICNTVNNVTKAMRLAPSAVNSQPWIIDYQTDKIVIKYKGRGILQAYLKKKLSKIDLGIITAIAEAALIEDGKKIKSIEPKNTAKSYCVEIVFE